MNKGKFQWTLPTCFPVYMPSHIGTGTLHQKKVKWLGSMQWVLRLMLRNNSSVVMTGQGLKCKGVVIHNCSRHLSVTPGTWPLTFWPHEVPCRCVHKGVIRRGNLLAILGCVGSSFCQHAGVARVRRCCSCALEHDWCKPVKRYTGKILIYVNSVPGNHFTKCMQS